MKATAHNSTAERAGRALGRAARTLGRLDRIAQAWLIAQGLPPILASAVLWLAKLVVIGTLLYAVSWAVLILTAVIAVVVGSGGKQSDEEWAIGEQADHKKSVFYDPRNYNDDPDSRFDDDR